MVEIAREEVSIERAPLFSSAKVVRHRCLYKARRAVSIEIEEGVRFPSTLGGSRALAGLFHATTLEERDVEGISRREALLAFGCDSTRIAAEARLPEDIIGYVEVHIELGPVLDPSSLTARRGEDDTAHRFAWIGAFVRSRRIRRSLFGVSHIQVDPARFFDVDRRFSGETQSANPPAGPRVHRPLSYARIANKQRCASRITFPYPLNWRLQTPRFVFNQLRLGSLL